MATRNQYREASDQLWQRAQAELQQGAPVQASEKLWGVAAQAVKAVAEARGWPHRSHSALYDVIGRLQEETGQMRLGTLFGVANALHQNFYEQWMPLSEVRRRAADIQELQEALFSLLEAP